MAQRRTEKMSGSGGKNRTILTREDDDYIKEIDQHLEKRFRWNWSWMEKDNDDNGICHDVYIRKIDKPGVALCIWCDRELSYGRKGIYTFVQHSNLALHKQSSRPLQPGDMRPTKDPKLKRISNKKVDPEKLKTALSAVKYGMTELEAVRTFKIPCSQLLQHTRKNWGSKPKPSRAAPKARLLNDEEAEAIEGLLFAEFPTKKSTNNEEKSPRRRLPPMSKCSLIPTISMTSTSITTSMASSTPVVSTISTCTTSASSTCTPTSALDVDQNNEDTQSIRDVKICLPTIIEDLTQHKKKKPTSESTRELLDDAVDCVINEGMSNRVAAFHFGIPKSTLNEQVARTKKGLPPPTYDHGRCRLLDRKYDPYIVELMKGLNCEMSERTLRIVVEKLLKDNPTIEHNFPGGIPNSYWCQTFFKRHPELRGLPRVDDEETSATICSPDVTTTPTVATAVATVNLSEEERMLLSKQVAQSLKDQRERERREKKSKPKKKRKMKKFNSELIDDAADWVINKGMSLGKVSRAFGIPKSTLSDHVIRKKKGLPMPPTTFKVGKYLDRKYEPRIVEMMKDFDCDTSYAALRLVIDQMFKDDPSIPNSFPDGAPGDAWCRLFFKRHPEARGLPPLPSEDFDIAQPEEAEAVENFDFYTEQVDSSLQDEGTDLVEQKYTVGLDATETAYEAPSGSIGNIELGCEAVRSELQTADGQTTSHLIPSSSEPKQTTTTSTQTEPMKDYGNFKCPTCATTLYIGLFFYQFLNQVDQLLLHVAMRGLSADKLLSFQRKLTFEHKPRAEESEFKEFKDLYSKLTRVDARKKTLPLMAQDLEENENTFEQSIGKESMSNSSSLEHQHFSYTAEQSVSNTKIDIYNSKSTRLPNTAKKVSKKRKQQDKTPNLITIKHHKQQEKTPNLIAIKHQAIMSQLSQPMKTISSTEDGRNGFEASKPISVVWKVK